jgi:preprotein translocase subunit SecE
VAKAVSNNRDKGSSKGGAKGAKSGTSKSLATSRQQAAAARLARAKARRAPGRAGKGKQAEKRQRGKFLRDVRAEMGKVSWPSRKDLIQSTIVVIVAVAIATVFTFGLDSVFSRVVDFVVGHI